MEQEWVREGGDRIMMGSNLFYKMIYQTLIKHSVYPWLLKEMSTNTNNLAGST